MATAWGGGDRTAPSAAAGGARGDGFQAVALSLSERNGRAAPSRGLLDPEPARPAARRLADAPRRPRLQQVAEATQRRR
jgi:hypothetical protein